MIWAPEQLIFSLFMLISIKNVDKAVGVVIYSVPTLYCTLRY